jgi:addiction module RelE/StbE family toxin
MRILNTKKFNKAFSKISPKIQAKFYEATEILLINPLDPRLRKHALSGKFKGIWTINITGDWRLLYEEINESTILLLDIGTHSQLYK